MGTRHESGEYDETHPPGDTDYEAENSLILFVSAAVVFIIGVHNSSGGTMAGLLENPWANSYTAAVEGLNTIVFFGDPAIAVPVWIAITVEMLLIKMILNI